MCVGVCETSREQEVMFLVFDFLISEAVPSLYCFVGVLLRGFGGPADGIVWI